MTGWPASPRWRWIHGAAMPARWSSRLATRTVVVDHFHAVRLANTVVDQVRRQTQQATLGHRGRKPDPLYRIRKLLLTAAEQLTSRGRVRLRAGLAAGDPDGEVVAAWQGKELLRAVYAASDLAQARARWSALPLGGRRWGGGVVAAGPHGQGLGGRDPRLPLDQGLLQRAHRGHESAYQEGQACRARFSQLHQLPPAAAVALRRQVADSPDRTIARTPSTLGGVEPVMGTYSPDPGPAMKPTGRGHQQGQAQVRPRSRRGATRQRAPRRLPGAAPAASQYHPPAPRSARLGCCTEATRE
jgi:hypothetical protein